MDLDKVFSPADVEDLRYREGLKLALRDETVVPNVATAHRYVECGKQYDVVTAAYQVALNGLFEVQDVKRGPDVQNSYYTSRTSWHRHDAETDAGDIRSVLYKVTVKTEEKGNDPVLSNTYDGKGLEINAYPLHPKPMAELGAGSELCELTDVTGTWYYFKANRQLTKKYNAKELTLRDYNTLETKASYELHRRARREALAPWLVDMMQQGGVEIDADTSIDEICKDNPWKTTPEALFYLLGATNDADTMLEGLQASFVDQRGLLSAIDNVLNKSATELGPWLDERGVRQRFYWALDKLPAINKDVDLKVGSFLNTEFYDSFMAELTKEKAKVAMISGLAKSLGSTVNVTKLIETQK